jgi:hypothetical protein
MYNIQIEGHMHPERQFECKVVLDSELDSMLDFEISNWFGSPPFCVRLLDSPPYPWCPVRSPHYLYGS